MLPQVLDLRGAAKEEPRFLHGASKHDKIYIYKADKKRRITAATSDLAVFLFSMIAPVKISVNHLRTVVSMHALNSMAPVPH